MKKIIYLVLPFLMLFTSCNHTNITSDLYNDKDLKFKIFYNGVTIDDLVKAYQKNKNVSNIVAYNNKLHFTYKTVIDVEKIGYDTTQFSLELQGLNITMHVTVGGLHRTVLKLDNLVIYRGSERVFASLNAKLLPTLELLITDLALLELQPQ